MTSLAITVVAGVLIGAILGTVGSGGSILAVPALAYGVGLPLHEAMATALLVVFAASVTSVVPRLRGGVDWTAAVLMALSGIPFALAGSVLGQRLSDVALTLTFAAVLLLGAGLVLKGSESGEAAADRSEFQRADLRRTVPRGVSMGAAVGTLTGILGVGGGFLIVPALTMALELPMPLAVGTSLVVIAINSAVGFASHLAGTHLDWTITLAFAAATMGAALLSSRLSLKLPAGTIRRVFCGVVIFVSTVMAVKAIV
ncbi:sulfite exporter TauE/SafE family protein [Streptomyces sp. NPDC000880]